MGRSRVSMPVGPSRTANGLGLASGAAASSPGIADTARDPASAVDSVPSPTVLAPVSTWDDLGGGGHSVQFYATDAFLLDGLSRFVGRALGAGDAALVLATEAHRHALADRLRARGFDLDGAVAHGRYIALDAAETLALFMVDRWPDASRFTEIIGEALARATAAAIGETPRVAAYGELVALLCAAGNAEAAIRVEQLWNELAAAHRFDLHCGYPIGLFPEADDADTLARVCAEHAHVVPVESYTTLIGADQQLRAITLLQQKAQALEREVEERRRTERRLLEAIAARDEFLSTAAHELKTPVTSLRGYVQLLLRSADRDGTIAPERLRTGLRTIERQTENLRELLRRLLDASQIDAGKLRIEPSAADLAGLARGVVARQGLGIHHELVFEGPERLEGWVDPLRFEQVIVNLLDNAIKFSPECEKVTIELSADDGEIRLAVTDWGIGIPADQRAAIFERFHQAHSRDYLSGLGLGLHIAREIVELHGGTIRAEQPDHPGARFVVVLPVRPEAESAA